jgi:hypothetical protein
MGQFCRSLTKGQSMWVDQALKDSDLKVIMGNMSWLGSLLALKMPPITVETTDGLPLSTIFLQHWKRS